MRASKVGLGVGIGALVPVGVLVVIAWRSQQAGARAYAHTTGLGTGTYDFTGASEDSVNATFSSASPLDELLRATLHRTPSGGTEVVLITGETARSGASGTIDLTTACPVAELGSGDRIRAVFQAFDGRGNETFSRVETFTRP